jgi:predicted phage-related endonuclease
MNQEQFQAERRSCIGSSDWSDVFDLEPYGCSLRLWYSKRNVIPDYDYSAQQLKNFRRGHALEPVIADEYARITGRIVSEAHFMRHPKYEFLGVHMDRLTGEPMDYPQVRYLEIKAPGYGIFKKIKQEGLSHGWILQLQSGIEIGRANNKDIIGGSYAVMNVDMWELIKFDVEMDQDLVQTIIDKGMEFWPKVENGPAPEKKNISDSRCKVCQYRMRCHGEDILIANDPEHAREYEDIPGFDVLMREAMELQELASEAKALSDKADEELKKALQGPRKIKHRGIGVNSYKYIMEKWDAEALNAWVKDHPRLKEMLKPMQKKVPVEKMVLFRY